jgi:hypothetical protein
MRAILWTNLAPKNRLVRVRVRPNAEIIADSFLITHIYNYDERR